MPLDDLYQELILDHYRAPRHKGPCPGCGREVKQDNPLCGDVITLRLEVQDKTIARIAHEGQGCSISQASASMMAEAVLGQPVAQALELGQSVRALMRGESPSAEQEQALGDLMALQGVASFPVRVKCALLPWTALQEALAGAAPQPPVQEESPRGDKGA